MLIKNNTLKQLYFILKEQRRNRARRRFYYRKITKEKLRLAELGECQECIKNYCRYLSRVGMRIPVKACEICISGQMSLHFS